MKNKAPAIHIAPEHQSAPQKSWADKEIEKAAEEIRTGQFVPQVDEEDLIPVLLQRGTHLQAPGKVKMDELQNTNELLQHPRVQEALARLEQEHREAKTSQEALEKSAALFEMNERTAQKSKWDGQGRWIGEENEEMRIGLILTPFQFMERLEKVIGQGRVMLNRFAVLKRVALLVEDKTPKTLILLPGQPAPREDGLKQVATLQWPCTTEFMVMKFDEYGVPTTAKYLGWRTALLSLIQNGVITEKEAHKAFPVTPGPASSWYREQLYRLRSERGIVN